MDKPLSIKRLEFTQKLSQLVNTAELPPLMVNDILIMVQSQVQHAIDAQTSKDIDEWNKFNTTPAEELEPEEE